LEEKDMVCRAAVKIYDKRQDKEMIIPCHRHCDAFQILHDFGYKKGEFDQKTAGHGTKSKKYVKKYSKKACNLKNCVL
jgi:hypothetical protein